MAANVDVEKQFLRLFMFSHKISLPVVRTFFVSNVLGKSNYNNDIITFLQHHKHELFHLLGDYKCCQCTKLPSLQPTVYAFRLGNNQFNKLYDVGISQPGHFSKGSRGRVFQQCLCCVTVRKETNPKTYDISLLITILYNCVQLSDNNRLWLDTIRKCRNRLCHLNDINEFSQSEIQTLWGNLECSVLMVAAEVTAQPDYKESIETQVDILKYADYSRDVVTPIMEAMKLEINNNINGIKQNQIVVYDAMKCLTTNVKELAHNCKEDNKKMSEHVSSTMAVLSTQQDAFNNLSAQVAQCHIKDVEHQKKVSETMEHAIQKLNFVVEIVNQSHGLGTDESLQKNDTVDKSQCQGTAESLQNNDTCEKTSTTEEQKRDDDSETMPYKLRWKIETPGHLEHKKDDIVKVLKKAIEIVKIGTSHEIEDVYEGSITIETLLPMSILQEKEAFHHSIRTFLTAFVSICGIDTTIPLEVKVQITLIDQEKGSVRYSIDEMNHTTMINQAVQAVPTMIERSTTAMESHINETTDNPDCIQKAGDVLMLYGMQIKDNTLLQPSEMQSAVTNYDDKKRSIIADFHEPNILLIGCFKDVEWVESILTVCESFTPICQIQNTKMSKKLLNTKTVKYIVYIASRSSHGSYNLKPLLECLSESKRFLNEIVTIRMDNVMPPDMLIESKQISISDVEEEWVPSLMDAIAMTGSMMYSLTFYKKSNFVPNFEPFLLGDSYLAYTDDIEGCFVLLGSFKHVTFIGSILSKFSMDFKIHVRQKSSLPLNYDNMKGIVCLLSKDLHLEYLLHPVILHSNLWPLNVVTVLMNQMNLPKILLDTIQVDATGNNEDWVQEFINAVQNMPSKAYILRFREGHRIRRQRSLRYVEGNEPFDNGFILVMGDANAIAWFNSVLSMNKQTPMVQLEAVPYIQLRIITIKSIICIIANSSNDDLSLHPNMKRFECWPNNVITVVRKNMTVPNLLKGTKQYFDTGYDANWLTDVMDEISRLLSIVNILRFTVDENFDVKKVDVLLIGNTIDVQWFYSTLNNSKRIVHSEIKLKQIALEKLCRKTIKSIICVVPEGSKEEDFFPYRNIKDFECWPTNVITVVRHEMAVSNLFQGTKRIDCIGNQEEWLSNVMDSINKAMSIVNILRIMNYNSDGDFCDVFHEDVLLMGNTIDVQWFCSALIKSEKAIHLNIELKQIALEKLRRTAAIKSIICVLPENSKEIDILYQNVRDFGCGQNNVITVVRDEVTVPSLFQGTYRIDCTGSHEEWLSKVIDSIHKATSMVYICVYGPARYSPPYHYNEIGEIENSLILLKGNTAAVLWFYSTLEKLESILGSSMELMRIKSRNIRRTHIKSIICIITKSTKEEEVFNKDLESFKNDVVTVVRDKVSVPIFLKETKQIEEDSNDEKWILDVVDVIHRQMSLVYTLRFINKSVKGIKRNRYRAVRTNLDEYTFIVLMGKTKDVRCFYSDLSKSENTLDSFMGLVLMPLGELQHAVIKGIICVVAESTKEEDFLLISKFQYEPEIVTVVRNKMAVPRLLKDTKQINDTGTDDKWLSDVVDIINRMMSMVYTLRSMNKNVHQMQTNCTRAVRTDLEDYKCIVLMGNTKEVRCFYSDLSKSQKTIDSYMSLVLMPSGELDKTVIKGIICVVAESSKEEDFSLISKFQYLYEAETFTVVRNKMAVPSLLKDTKQISDNGTGDKWLSNVVDMINRKMLMVYILRYTKDRSRYMSVEGYLSMHDDKYRWIWLIGNTNEIRWFYSALSTFDKNTHIELLHVPSMNLHTIRVQNIIYIIAKTTTEHFLQQPHFEDLHFEPTNVITVVQENTRVPNLLKKTKQINVTGNDDKWLSDVLDQLKSIGDRDDKSEDSGITSIDENY